MSKPKKQDDGYPFDTGHWARWDNAKKLEWLTNFRDQLKKDDCRGAKKYNLMDKLDQIEKDVEAMEKVVAQEEAMKSMQKKNPANPFSDIDDTALKQAFASGDEAAVDREWNIWIAKIEARAATDPKLAKWYDEFCKDQETLLRWDDVIGDKSD